MREALQALGAGFHRPPKLFTTARPLLAPAHVQVVRLGVRKA
jgi:hypothetical protein